MLKYPILHYIKEIKDKLGFSKTLDPSIGATDVVDAVNKQSNQIGDVALPTTAQTLTGAISEQNRQIEDLITNSATIGTPSVMTNVAENYEYTATKNCFVIITIDDNTGTVSAPHAAGIYISINGFRFASIWGRWTGAVNIPFLTPLKKGSVLKLIKNDNWPYQVKVSIMQ